MTPFSGEGDIVRDIISQLKVLGNLTVRDCGNKKQNYCEACLSQSSRLM